MSPSILLCALLLVSSTCSSVDINTLSIKEQPQGLPDEQSALEDLRLNIIDISENVSNPAIFLSRLVAFRKVLQQWWNTCLEKVSAYSNNQGFFKHALPAFIDELMKCGLIDPPLMYAADTMFMYAKILYEQQFCSALLRNIDQIASFFADECSPFEGLSDEFLTLAAKYIRSTLGIRRLYSMVEKPNAFAIPESVDEPQLFEPQLLSFLVSLEILTREIQKVGLMGVYGDLSDAIQATRETMVPANEAFLKYLTDDVLVGEVSLLAEKAIKAISAPGGQYRVKAKLDAILVVIEDIAVPLYRAHLGLDRGVAEQQGEGEVLWSNFLESLFAFGSILAKPNLGIIRQVSETCSEFLDHLLDTFLRGEDESWTFGVKAKLDKAEILWNRAMKASASALDVREEMPWSKYKTWFSIDLSVIFNVIYVVEKLEDPLALDRPTREKFVEFWRETRAIWKLLLSLSSLEATTERLKGMEREFGIDFVIRSLSEVLDEPISVLQRHGVNFQLGTYHQFINDLPEHQAVIARHLEKTSDRISRMLVDGAAIGKIETLFSPLKSRPYTPLKRSLTQLFKDPPRLLQPQDLALNPRESNDKQPKGRRNRSKRNIKSCKAAVSKVPVPTHMQAFVRSGPQCVQVDVNKALESTEDPSKLFKEALATSWISVRRSRNRQTSKSLASQSARDILKGFASRPVGWDGIPPTVPRDMRSDKTKVKVATFNVEWLFLFNLSTEKLEGRIKWKSLKDAWDHIKDVADAIRKINADIICLCEVQDMRILSILVQLLPELNYRAYLIPNHDSLGQNVGILTRVDTFVSVYRIEEWSFPKNIVFHLHLENGRGGLVDLVLTGVHLISSTAEADHVERARHREDQARVLKQHLASHYGTLGDAIHLVLGDFNMVDPGLCSTPFADQEEALKVVKYGEFNLYNAMDPKCTSNSSSAVPLSVCHIFASHHHLVADARFVSLDGPCRLGRVSDHSPVVATIHLPTYR